MQPRHKLPQSFDRLRKSIIFHRADFIKTSKLTSPGASLLVLTCRHLAELRVQDLDPVRSGQLAAVHQDAELLPAHVALRAAWSMGMAFMLCMLAEALYLY